MSFKSIQKAKRIAGRKIARRDRGQRKEIGRLTRELSDQMSYSQGQTMTVEQLHKAVNVLASVLDTWPHRWLSALRRTVRCKSEIPAALLSSMKARRSSSEPST